MTLKKSKVIAFIDAANIIYGAKRESGFKVDLKKLVKYLKTRFQASKIYFYGGVNTRKINFDEYKKMLEGFGLIPRLKKTKLYYQKPKYKSFICRFCKRRNTVKQRARIRTKANCFLSGDGDFAPLMEMVKILKKELYVIASSKKTAKSIKKIAAERFVEIRNLKEIIAKKDKKRRRHF